MTLASSSLDWHLEPVKSETIDQVHAEIDEITEILIPDKRIMASYKDILNAWKQKLTKQEGAN